MKKISLLLAVLLVSATTVSAALIGKSEAQAKAAAFFQKKSMKAPAKGSVVKLAKEYASNDEAQTAIYAFARGENVVFVSADDQMPAILGYSSDSDLNDLPPAMEAMLHYYARLTDAVRNGEMEAPKLYASPTKVDSLCHTIWNQVLPFSLLCPKYGGEQLPNGCVSTGLAQVMKFHAWPVNPTGVTPAYKTAGLKIDVPSENLSTHTYKWGSMIDDYRGAYTEEQGQAVAQLCYDVAVASDMDFNLVSTGGSGTSLVKAAQAMRTYFGYNKDMKIDYAAYYTEAEWVAKLKNEINNNRPLPYCAFSKGWDGSVQGGHCFVIDGYNEEGLFHVNWGWGSKSNGNFLITTLDPKEQGIGGSTSDAGFPLGQQTIFDFYPDYDGTTTTSEHYLFQYNRCVGSGDDNIEIEAFTNRSLDPFEGDLILQIVDKNGKVAVQRVVKTGYTLGSDKHENVCASLKDFDFSNLADGIYHTDMLAVSSATGNEYKVHHMNTDSRIVIENGALKYVLNSALLEGQILSYEVTDFDDMSVSLKVKIKATNVDDIDYDNGYGVSLFGEIFYLAGGRGESGSEKYENVIKVGQTVTFDQDILLMFDPEEFDQAMVRLILSYKQGILDTREFAVKKIVTGITDVKADQAGGNAPAFNLNGQRVDASSATGIIIQNGKKTYKK